MGVCISVKRQEVARNLGGKTKSNQNFRTPIPILVVFRYDMGRPSSSTKLASNVTIRTVRARGGNIKYRALRLDSGCFAWPSEVNYAFVCFDLFCI